MTCCLILTLAKITNAMKVRSFLACSRHQIHITYVGSIHRVSMPTVYVRCADHLALGMELLGPMPSPLYTQGEHAEELFQTNGQLRYDDLLGRHIPTPGVARRLPGGGGGT